ncbi:MAG: hypothetical protein AAF236_14685 [Verrucomicrobiota bacterium]
MRISWNRFAFILGAFIIGLIVIEMLLQVNEKAFADFGFGVSKWAAADSLAAVFMVGLVVGMISGIAIFFAYIVHREKKFAEAPDDIDQLLEEIAQEEERQTARGGQRQLDAREEPGEGSDPWEQDADWWRKVDE